MARVEQMHASQGQIRPGEAARASNLKLCEIVEGAQNVNQIEYEGSSEEYGGLY